MDSAEEILMPQLVKKAVEKRRARVLKTRPQVRKTFPPEVDLRALARSVMKRQLHPLLILPDETILDGECRWRGLMLENPEFEVDVIVMDHELAPGEASELQLISALHSTTLTAYDQAVASREWMERNPGATAKELAEKIDRDPSMLTRLNSLWKTILPVIKAAEENKIGPKAWYQISLLPQADQLRLLELYLSGMPSGQIAKLSRKQRTPASAAPTVKVAKIRCPLGSGAIVQISGQGISLNDAIEAAQEWVKEAKKASEQGLDAKTFERVCKDKAKVK
jgi:ParB family transcriptional regulator, chromosome partitioning protein